MNRRSTKADPWPKILDLLGQRCAREYAESHPLPTTTSVARTEVDRTRMPCNPAFLDMQGFRTCVRINVLELTESFATIGWYDPTRCRYGDQRWGRFKTLHAGVCAISGARIAAGTDVFRPVPTRSGAANADAMILARALQCVFATDSA
jgi:hypothetical protein